MVFGIDISKWQGSFNMEQAVKEGVKFVIIKGGGGDNGLYRDSRFEQNYEKAKTLRLPVGVYWFSKATTTKQAEEEAKYFYWNITKGRQFELPVYIDVEHDSMLKLTKRNLTNIIKTWCDYLEKRGFYVGIYASIHTFYEKVYDSELTRYTHWVAQWSKQCNYTNKNCLGMWQFGGEYNALRGTKVAGVVTDQDYMLVDYPTLIKKAGLNGFTKGKKSVYEIALEVICGDWGIGSTRKKRLTEAGYNYDEVQKEVNKILSK